MDVISKHLIDDSSWVKRMERYFDYMDQDRYGIISINKVQQWASNMEELCNATPNEMVKLRAQLYDFWGGIGLKGDVMMTKKQFIEGADRFGNEEMRRNKGGYTTYLDKVNNAFFDIIDRDKDDVLTIDELKAVMVATDKKKKNADKFLQKVDTDENGVINREEFLSSERNFWFKMRGN